MKYAEFIELAKANYTKGGDSYYECWDEQTFNEYEEMFGKITKKIALRMFKDNAEITAEYEAAAKWYGGMDQETIDIINKENAEFEAKKAKEDKSMTTFTLNGVIYKTNDKGNYYYKSTDATDKKGQPLFMRIAKHVWEKAFEEYVNTAHMDDDEWDLGQEIEDRKQKEAEDAKQVEQEFNDKKEQPKKKARKPRRSKDIAYEMTKLDGEVSKTIVTLTAKQVDFIKQIPTTCFYENGLDSCLWCDCLADEMSGQFFGKPMTVGAMISTLREKNIINVNRDDSRQGKPKYMTFTDLGKQVAKELGLK